MEALREDEQDLVRRFLEITALGDEHIETGIQVLQSNNWGLDQSLQSFFSGASTTTNSAPRQPPQRGRRGMSTRTRVPPTLPWPLSLLETIVNTILQIGEPETIADAFNRIGIGSYPNFLTGSFTSTLRQARQEKKMLCVYFHSPSHDDTPRFLEALAAPEICNYMDHHFVSYAVNVQNPVGYRLESGLKITGFPVLVFGEAQSSTKFHAHMIQVGIQTQEELLQTMTDRHNTFLAVQAQRTIQEAQRNQDRQMRVNQDDDYDRLLAEAKRKQEAEEEQKMMQQREREEEERKLEEEQTAQEWRDAVRLEAATRLPPEPSGNEPNIMVKIRLPSGTTVERRFQKTNLIEHIRNFVQSQELTTIENEYIDDFILLEPFPRKLYDNDELSLEEAFGRCRVAKLVCQERLSDS